MKWHISAGCFPWGGLFAWGMFLLAGPAVAVAGDLARPVSAETLVRDALQAEIAGNAQERHDLLARALTTDPDSASARWQSGFVRLDDQWLATDEIERRWSADERLAKYRRLRAARAGTPAGELALARWCRDQDLGAEARIHWLRLLLFQPQNEEALKNLGMRWYNGELLTVEQIRQRHEGGRSDAEEDNRPQDARLFHGGPPAESWTKHWRPLVANWRRAIDRDSDLDSSIRDALTAAGPDQGLETLDEMLCRACAMKKDDAYQKLSAKLVEVLDEISEPWATLSLGRYAVFHPNGDVRKAAAEALKTRPLEEVVPPLLSSMRWPVEASFVILNHPDGSVTYQHSFYREGLHADVRVTRNDSTYIGTGPTMVEVEPGGEDRVAEVVGMAKGHSAAAAARASAIARVGAATTAIARQREAEEVSARDRRLNERIGEVLCYVTGTDLQPHPKYWHAWWQERYRDYYELEKRDEPTDEKPVYESHFVTTRSLDYTPAPVRVPPPPSCFPRGTVVWTLTGPVGIETIRPGDRVLSQHPVTGELAYKPVLQVTTRDPSPMIKVNLGSETIAATRGHPFWVAGEGWRMAKQLDAGLPLHTLSGAVPIESAEEAPAAKAWYDFSYNLIVDDFHTYFVGQSRLLVHDNQLYIHDPDAGPLPGLAKQ